MKRRQISLVAILVLAACAVGVSLPAQLGGVFRYVIVSGSSMHPAFADGDLVIVGRAATAAMGSPVLYWEPYLRRTILHRVIGRDADGHLVTRGDANSFADPYHPSPDEILGEPVARLPHVGSLLNWLRSPDHAAAFAGLLGAVPAFRRRRGSGDGRRSDRIAGGVPLLADAAIAAAVLIAAAIVVGWAAYRSSPTTTVQAPGHPVTVRLTYSAAAFGPPVTDSRNVAIGDAVFRRAAGAVVFSPSAGEGIVLGGPTITIDDARGWRRTLGGAVATTVHGGSAVTLNLDLLDGLLHQFEKVAAVPSTRYAIRLVVPVLGRRGDVAWSASFAFAYDGDRLVPASGGLTVRHTPQATRHTVAARIRWLPGQPGRTLTLMTSLIIGMMGAAVLIACSVTNRRPQPPEVAARRHDVPMVDVRAAPVTTRQVELASADDLARLASCLHLPIFAASSDGTLCVVTDDTTYRVAVEDGAPRAPARAA
jgi:signal peptidase I